MRPCEQIMASLPAACVTSFSSPFTSASVDYSGPPLVKQRRSHVKRYGCIFTCLVMRAVHIEIAHSLDTEPSLVRLPGLLAKEDGRRRYTATTEQI